MPRVMHDEPFFLEKFSAIYPYSHCIWRVPEASAQAAHGRLAGPVLDLGCGDGTYAEIFFNRTGRPVDPQTGQPAALYGIDPQQREIDRAARRGLYTKLFCGTSSVIPLPDASVRSVFSNSVVEHIPDKDGTIREVARILMPGGTYLFSAPSHLFAKNFRIRAFLNRTFGHGVGEKWVDLINRKFRHYWLQSPEQWRADLARHGLQLVSWRYTLTAEHAAAWERGLPLSFLQHVLAKRFGTLPFSSVSRRGLRRQADGIAEPSDLAEGGNLVLLARKSV